MTPSPEKRLSKNIAAHPQDKDTSPHLKQNHRLRVYSIEKNSVICSQEVRRQEVISIETLSWQITSLYQKLHTQETRSLKIQLILNKIINSLESNNCALKNKKEETNVEAENM